MKRNLKWMLLPMLLSAALGLRAQETGHAAEASAAQAAAAAGRAAEDQARAAARQAEAAGRSAERDAERAARMAERAARDAARAARVLQPAPTEQEQLAIAALEGLMAAPPERSLPLLKRVLEGPQTDLVKMRALFVLSQVDTDEAQQLLLDRARNGQGELRIEALRMVGVGGDETALKALGEIYQSGDSEVRDAVLHAYLIAGRKAEIAALARSAGNPDDAREAVQALGALGALDELRQLSDLTSLSGELVHAYAIAGDLDSLRKLASNAPDSETRVEAVRSIGIVGSEEAGTALREIYRGSQDPQVRRAALEGLMIQGNEAALLEIYRASSDAQEKQTVLRQLTIIGGDAALEAIDAALQGKAP
jgi:HEAT repeat protein